ncbi:MAG: F0F1 ATP synthase subunit A [Chitinivibrionales bacterium]
MSADVEFTLLPALPLPGLTAHQALVVEYTWLSMAIIIVSLIAVIVSLKTVPRGLQNAFELIVSFIEGYITDIMGEKGLRYFPLVITAFTFILVANYVGLIPGFISPTANISTTAGWAIVVFIFYQYVGVSKKGLKYFKHFLGPVPAMAPFMVVMETISEFARPFSLAVRLFANIFGGEHIIALLFGIVGIGLPVVWMMWDSCITIPIQAFIFSLLTMVYLGGAIAADDEH